MKICNDEYSRSITSRIAETLSNLIIKPSHCKHDNHPLKWIRNIYSDEINKLNAKSIWECVDCKKRFYKNYVYNPGEVSDGYHTFNELYHHRAILFAVICDKFPALAWKSLLHHNPEDKMYDGMFIVGINTPNGQATYHYDINPYWDGVFKNVRECDIAPEYDGHTPEEAIERIKSLIKS